MKALGVATAAVPKGSIHFKSVLPMLGDASQSFTKGCQAVQKGAGIEGRMTVPLLEGKQVRPTLLQFSHM